MSAPSLFLFQPGTPEGVEVWQIEVPLPPRAASPNARAHWTQLRGNKGEILAYRDLCARIYREASLPPLKVPVVIHLDFFYCRGKPETHPHLWHWRKIKKVWQFPFCVCHDEDNARASFKGGLDALQDAGIVAHDSRRSIKTGFCNIHGTAREHRGRTCVIVTIQGERL